MLIISFLTLIVLRWILPSSNKIRWPFFIDSKIFLWGSDTRFLFPISLFKSNKKISFFLRRLSSSSTDPIRIFGPWRSTKIPMGFFTISSARLIFLTYSLSYASFKWEQLRRNAFAPDFDNSIILFIVLEAGPRVAKILVFLWIISLFLMNTF